MQRLIPIVIASLLLAAPPGARAADLVVRWDKAIYPKEEEALHDTVAAFEQKTGKQVKLTFYPQEELADRISKALEAGDPPDFAFGVLLNTYIPRWALEDRLLDLSDSVGSFSNLFDPYQLDRDTLLNSATRQRALYGLPIGQVRNQLYVWKSLLEQAGFTLADIPRQWDAFWSFWCDRVQPAVRRATGREDIWGIGLVMSAEPDDTVDQFLQFVVANEADYVTRDGKLVIDDPEVRRKLVTAIDSYTNIYRKGCTPPDSVLWDGYGNNKAFLAQSVVMTPNYSLSIVNALKNERPNDYYENTATIEWPLGPSGAIFPDPGGVLSAVVFNGGRNAAGAKEFVRFLVAEGWLMHYLDFSGERFLPSISALLDQPFWLDPHDRHHMIAVMQAKAKGLATNYTSASGNLRHDEVYNQRIWAKAIHRIVTEGISPEQAVDEAIALIKQILAE
jgi:multiple sugar transport system substrate-binding protein